MLPHLALVFTCSLVAAAVLTPEQKHSISELEKDIGRTRYVEGTEGEDILRTLLVRVFTEHPEYHFYQVSPLRLF